MYILYYHNNHMYECEGKWRERGKWNKDTIDKMKMCILQSIDNITSYINIITLKVYMSYRSYITLLCNLFTL